MKLPISQSTLSRIGQIVFIIVITIAIFVGGFYLGQSTSVGYQDFQRVEQKIDKLNHWLGMDLK